MSASLATHWVANLAIGQLFLPALGAFGVSAVYLFFAAVCAATVAFTGSQVVETKARPLAVQFTKQCELFRCWLLGAKRCESQFS